MDLRGFVERLKGLNGKRKTLLMLAGGTGVLMIAGLGFLAGARMISHARLLMHVAGGQFSLSAITGRYGEAWRSVQAKVDELRQAELENERLQLENSHMRLKLEALQYDCRQKDAAAVTRDLESKLKKETGSKLGRTLANISYKPPTHLTPTQLYTLGVSYFKAREDEKAAVIFSLLTGLEDSDLFKTAKNYLLTGVAWYRLENFELADFYFDQVLKTAENPDTQLFKAQARLWRALAAERVNQHSKSQAMLRDLVDHHPHSMEAGWVNNREARRALAGED